MRVLRGDPGWRLWPVLLILLLGVLVPTTCVLWFMREAMRNERLAVREKLERAYTDQLAAVQKRLERFWWEDNAAWKEPNLAAGPGVIFQNFAGTVCDSVIVCDSSGTLLYPNAVSGVPEAQLTDEKVWAEAQRLEYGRLDPVAAADVYAMIADGATNVHVAARALQAQTRCFVKAGRNEEALQILVDSLGNTRFRDARDPHGRLIVPDAQLFALRLLENSGTQRFQETSTVLIDLVADYANLTMPSSQRQFLMHELQALVPHGPRFPTLAAEETATAYLEAVTMPRQPSTILAPVPELDELWEFTLPDGQTTLLFTSHRIVSEVRAVVESTVSLSDATVKVLPKGPPPAPRPFLSVPAADYLPGWTLALYLDGPDPFASAARRQTLAYLWTASLVILTIAVLSALVAWYMVRQMRLTQLRNDLIATVSHELKTPLSSMRVLVDTLLEGRCRDARHEREYLELVAKENVRLSHLIDNFLSFSRMEQGKQVFEFTDLAIGDVVAGAVAAVGDRFEPPGCTLDLDVAADLPHVRGDQDALVTVLINLLDNAYKYSGDDKHIVLRACASDGRVCIEVEDNGIGLSRRAAKKAFERFYQVDQSLSREAGGCGLGLSIVKFIVSAHGGSIVVASERDKGSTFTVRLPVAAEETS